MDTLDRKTLLRRGLLAGGGLVPCEQDERALVTHSRSSRATYLVPFRSAAEASVAAA